MSKKIDIDFGERLRQSAEKAGVAYSQTAIADYLGVRKQNVDGWMKGSLPRADQLFDMADKLKVDPRWFATGHNSDVRATIPNPKAKKLLAVLKELLDSDDESFDEIVAAVQSVSGEHGTAGHQRGRVKRPGRS